MTDTSGTIDVLVVDDDFMVAEIHRRFVERIDGFRPVAVARNGSEALTAAAIRSRRKPAPGDATCGEAPASVGADPGAGFRRRSGGRGPQARREPR